MSQVATKKSKKPAVAPVQSDDGDFLIPLSSLILSPKNVRKTSAKKIEELAAMIESQGLLQNLIVIEQIIAGKLTGIYEVVAGGRRLRALQLLVEQGRITIDFPVKCKQVAADAATEASTAENSGREEMHPADEFEAFQTMIAEGKSIEDVAVRFGITAIIVKRRLKLANVAPVFLALYREDKIKMEQLQALAVTDDHDKQISVWENAAHWDRDAFTLRRRLTENEVAAHSNPMACFVGLDAYEAANGQVRRDLFSNEGQGIYITDMELLRKLVLEKLEAAAEAVEAEGWKWVDVRETFGHDDRCSFGSANPSKREFSEEESAKLTALNEERDGLDIKKAELDDSEEDESDAINAIDELLDIVDKQIEHINASLIFWPQETLEQAGVIVTIDRNGALEIWRGLILPTDKKLAAAAMSDSAKTKPEFSEALTFALTSHRTIALQAALMNNPKVALVSLTHSLVVSAFCPYSSKSVKVSGSRCHHTLERHAEDIKESRAWLEVETKLEAWKKRMPEGSADIFGWLMILPHAEILELLVLCTAITVDATTSNPATKNNATDLSSALSLDMKEWWTVTGKTYLSRVPKDKVLEAVTEACGAESVQGLDKMKKGDMVAAAEQRMAGTGWLPTLLRNE